MKVGRFFVAGFLAMALLVVFGDRGLVDYFKVQGKLAGLQAENSRIVKDNEALRERILLLRYDREYLEMIARRELGMVRDGEVVYRFRDP